MSEPKNIVLGVSGSIAAHKAIDLASLLAKAGCVVDVVLTQEAQQFVQSLPFQTLTRRRVITSLYDEVESGVAHVRAADRADLLLVAPATANPTLDFLSAGASLTPSPVMPTTDWNSFCSTCTTSSLSLGVI